MDKELYDRTVQEVKREVEQDEDGKSGPKQADEAPKKKRGRKKNLEKIAESET